MLVWDGPKRKKLCKCEQMLVHCVCVWVYNKKGWSEAGLGVDWILMCHNLDPAAGAVEDSPLMTSDRKTGTPTWCDAVRHDSLLHLLSLLYLFSSFLSPLQSCLPSPPHLSFLNLFSFFSPTSSLLSSSSSLIFLHCHTALLFSFTCYCFSSLLSFFLPRVVFFLTSLLSCYLLLLPFFATIGLPIGWYQGTKVHKSFFQGNCHLHFHSRAKPSRLLKMAGV